MQAHELSNILFIDIETVSQFATFGELDDTFKDLWRQKTKQLLKKYDSDTATADTDAAEQYGRAAIYAEFGKIICISVGRLTEKEGEWTLHLKSFAHHDEATLLQEFAEMLAKRYAKAENFAFCGHNIKEFDLPYMCRRFLINNLPLPNMLDLAGKKPWEIKHLDTLEMWKFGDIKSYTSLKLLAAVFGIPSPKGDIDGSQVGRVYWEENDLARIAVYCEKDVLTVAQLLLRLRNLPLLATEQIKHQPLSLE